VKKGLGLIDIDIDIIDIFVNYNWVDTRWQYTLAHKQYTEHYNEQQNNTNNKKTRIAIWKSAGGAQSLQVLPWHLPYS
jgi:hypothetical protein